LGHFFFYHICIPFLIKMPQEKWVFKNSTTFRFVIRPLFCRRHKRYDPPLSTNHMLTRGEKKKQIVRQGLVYVSSTQPARNKWRFAGPHPLLPVSLHVSLDAIRDRVMGSDPDLTKGWRFDSDSIWRNHFNKIEYFLI